VSKLVVSPESDPATTLLATTDPAEIASALAKHGVVFERWEAEEALAADAGQAEVLDAYGPSVERIKAQGYDTVDVVRLHGDPNDPEFLSKAAEARNKFLAEHTHGDDEVRFFVEGRGAFYLRIDGNVHIALCETGDFLSVPKGTRHWFDMGTAPSFAAIRFFKEDEGWVGAFTGDPIASGFPTFDELVAPANA